MNHTTVMQMVSAGIQLYPKHGYHGLTGELIANYLNIRLSVYEEMFPDKDDFIKMVMREHSERSLGRLSFDFAPDMPAIERLRQILWRLAVSMRSNLPWLHRMLSDSAAGVEVIRRATKIQNEIITMGMVGLLRECQEGKIINETELHNQYDFLQGAVFLPMIMNSRHSECGVLADEVCGCMTDLMTDTALHQRIDWALKALLDDE